MLALFNIHRRGGMMIHKGLLKAFKQTVGADNVFTDPADLPACSRYPMFFRAQKIASPSNIQSKFMPKRQSTRIDLKALFTSTIDIAMLAVPNVVYLYKALNLFRLPATFRGGSIYLTANTTPSI
jgi:hypothetical protein